MHIAYNIYSILINTYIYIYIYIYSAGNNQVQICVLSKYLFATKIKIKLWRKKYMHVCLIQKYIKDILKCLLFTSVYTIRYKYTNL